MENPTQTFREVMNLVFQVTEELQIKSKTVMCAGACERKKECFFVTFILPEGIFFNYFCFSSIHSILNKLHYLLPCCSQSTT